MAILDQLTQAKNNALGTTPSNTIYASGKDLANAQNTYGNAYNYQNLATNPSVNLKQGDKVMGGSAVTPGITDDAINKAGAQRLYGNTSADTLAAMQTNSKSTLPQYYQNTNSTIAAGANYDKLALNDIATNYKNQLSDALTNSKYPDITYNTVGMDNTPYVNTINNALNNSNPSAYQNAIQQAYNEYKGIPTLSQLNSTISDINATQDQRNQALSQANQYYSSQLGQLKNLQQQAQTAKANGQDYSNLESQYNNLMSSATKDTTAFTPQDSASYLSNMTDKINNLYNTQKNNVASYYQSGIDQAKQQYQGLRNQASVTDQQNLNKLKESMAQQGLFNSGDNITAQTGINNQYANDLSGYNTQEQNYYNDVNNQIAQKKAEYDAQQAQALIDLGYKADDRSFKLANLNSDQKQQAFQNAMTAINAQYGMGQDQFGNTLKGTTTTYGMGRDNVSDQEYNNDTAMKADQINYGRNQDYFNNTLKTIAQQYGMDEDQVQNLLNYAKFNQSQDQRQFDNSTKANQDNYNIYNDQVKNGQSQQQITNQANQWQQNYDTQKDQWQKTFDNSNSQWKQTFDREGTWHDQVQALAQARANASFSSGRSGGGSRSSGSSKRSSSSSYGDYADDAAALAAQGYNSSFIKASMPTWDYQSLYNGENIPVYGGSR